MAQGSAVIFIATIRSCVLLLAARKPKLKTTFPCRLPALAAQRIPLHLTTLPQAAAAKIPPVCIWLKRLAFTATDSPFTLPKYTIAVDPSPMTPGSCRALLLGVVYPNLQ